MHNREQCRPEIANNFWGILLLIVHSERCCEDDILRNDQIFLGIIMVLKVVCAVHNSSRFHRVILCTHKNRSLSEKLNEDYS